LDPIARKLVERQLEGQLWNQRQEAFLAWAGLAAGLTVSLVVVVLAAWLIHDDHDLAGTVLGSVDLVSLVIVFVIGWRAETAAELSSRISRGWRRSR
jgi:hypothetical protein